MQSLTPAKRGEWFLRFEQSRRQAGITIEALCGAAGYSRPRYQELMRDPTRVTARCLTRLQRALVAIRKNALPATQLSTLDKAAFLGCLAAAHAAMPTADGARGRQASVYLAVTALGMSQAALARVTGLTPAAISKGIRRIEDLRDGAAFDAAIETAAALLIE